MPDSTPINPVTFNTATQHQGWSVIRWLVYRAIGSVTFGFLFCIFCGIVHETWLKSWLSNYNSSPPGGWFLDYRGDLRGSRIWGVGCVLGLFIPNVRLNPSFARIVLATLIGIPIGLLTMGGIDAEVVRNTLRTAYAPYQGYEYRTPQFGQTRVEPPRPDDWLYPTVYRDLVPRGIIGGAVVGLLAGVALSLKRLVWRWTVVVFATLVFGAICMEASQFVESRTDGGRKRLAEMAEQNLIFKTDEQAVEQR